jgi:polyphosphate kinase
LNSKKDLLLEKPPIKNRELSWLEFNERVLNLSVSENVPLFERAKFLAIFSSNLNEFFMIRVAGIKDQIAANYTDKDRSDMTPLEVYEAIGQKVRYLYTKESDCFVYIKDELKKEGFLIDEVDKEEAFSYIRFIFNKVINITLTPVTLTSTTPMPFIANKKIVILAKLKKEEEYLYGLVIVPENIEKVFTFKSDGKTYFFTLPFIIKYFLNEIFPGFEVYETAQVKVTRNADLDIEEEGAEDLLKLIEKSLDKRRRGGVVRIELIAENIESWKDFLFSHIDFDRSDLYIKNGMIDPTVFFHIKSDKSKHYYKKFTPYLPEIGEDIFETIKSSPITLYRPYNDFSIITELVKKAAKDKNTLAIKITIYRVNNDSKIVDALVEAAKRGISVSVVVELKARFDEENNIELAKRLEDAGCIVTYGFYKLKVHAKMLLIVRREKESIKGFVHLSTGNYNEQTAKIYTDIDYITSEEDIVEDVKEVFNYLMGYTELREKSRIFIAPLEIKNKLISLIDDEIKNAKNGKKAHIIIKVNSLIDKTLIAKLYEASVSKVKIELIVRGICGIVTNLKNLSENISVISIVGRFLEHPRIFYFYNNGDERLFISSADFMERNMDRRIETMIHIVEKEAKEKIKKILAINLKDNVNAYYLDKNIYKKVKTSKKLIDSQDFFIHNKF